MRGPILPCSLRRVGGQHPSLRPAEGLCLDGHYTKAVKPQQFRASRRIVLTGFMGSGKSTRRPLIAARLGWSFIDVDDVIEAEAGHDMPKSSRATGEARLPQAGA